MGRAWSKKAVGIVASSIGRVLRIQNKTLDPVAYGEARVLVSLRAEEEPPSKIWMEIEGQHPSKVDILYE